MSLGTLDEDGYFFKAGNVRMKVLKGSLVVMKGLKRNGLYILEGETLKDSACTAAKIDSDIFHL